MDAELTTAPDGSVTAPETLASSEPARTDAALKISAKTGRKCLENMSALPRGGESISAPFRKRAAAGLRTYRRAVSYNCFSTGPASRLANSEAVPLGRSFPITAAGQFRLFTG